MRNSNLPFCPWGETRAMGLFNHIRFFFLFFFFFCLVVVLFTSPLAEHVFPWLPNCIFCFSRIFFPPYAAIFTSCLLHLLSKSPSYSIPSNVTYLVPPRGTMLCFFVQLISIIIISSSSSSSCINIICLCVSTKDMSGGDRFGLEDHYSSTQPKFYLTLSSVLVLLVLHAMIPSSSVLFI